MGLRVEHDHAVADDVYPMSMTTSRGPSVWLCGHVAHELL